MVAGAGGGWDSHLRLDEARAGGGAFAYSNPNPSQTIDVLGPFDNSNRLESVSAGPNAAATNWSVWFVWEPPAAQDSNNYALIGTSNSFTSTTQGWHLSSGTGSIRLRIVTSGGSFDSPECGVTGAEAGGAVVIHAGVDGSGNMWLAKNGILQDGSTAVTGTYTSSAFDMWVLARAGGGTHGGKFIAAGIAGNLTSGQVETHYQALLSDYTATATGATNAWAAGDLSSGTLADSIGSDDLTEVGTVTTGTITQFNERWDPADVTLSAAHSTQIANTAGLLELMCVGDSITNAVNSASGAGFEEGVQALADASGDLTELTHVGPATTGGGDPQAHNGQSGWTISDHNDGNGTPSEAIDARLTSYSPELVSLLIGANDCLLGDDAQREAGQTAYLTLCRTILDSGARLLVTPLTPKESGGVNAQVQQLSWYLAKVAWPTLEAEGYTLTKMNLYSAVSHSAGDFADGTHPNDTGFGKLDDAIYAGVRRMTGRT